ncbi:MAG: MarR family transcriptional regulator [Dehalococcoidia bacterium]|nr:MarR family transcriptional regulator [Dehalococcoidia bacterium]
MDYTELADELLQKMRALHRAGLQQIIDSNLQGKPIALQCIAHHEANILPGDIANKLGVSSARVAAALNKLEDDGLITRQIDENDRRKILVSITKKGKDLAEKHQQAVTSAVSEMLQLLGEYDAKEYVRITGKLADIIPTAQRAINSVAK